MGKARRRAPRDRTEGDGDTTGDVPEDNSTEALDLLQHEGSTGDMIWAPTITVASVFVILIRLLSAGTTCIADCDETYNYWEPLHYLLYGFGLQTWEYAPQYALRSYFYLTPSLWVAKWSEDFLALFEQGGDKPQVWLGVRIFHVMCCSFCEILMYDAVRRKFGRRIGGFFLIFSATSAGIFVSAPALLPSSSSMTLFMLVMSLWLDGRFSLAIMTSMLCVFGTGWPFVGVIFTPMLLNCAWLRLTRGASFAEGLGAATASATWALMCAMAVGGLAMWTDSGWYGRTTSPTFNILKYNVLDAGEGRGDELYGVEPASYYLKNLFLNTSVAFPLSVALPVLALLLYPMADKVAKAELRQKLLMCSPGVLWLVLMFSKAHKEERFLYPIYPSIFLAAACTLDITVQAANEVVGKRSNNASANMKIMPQAAAMTCVLFAAALGMSRTMAVVRFHDAPCNMFKFVYYKELKAYRQSQGGQLDVMMEPLRLCVGGEWHRYPSSFYIPHKSVNFSFIRSEFHGQLPQPFREVNGTKEEPLQPFNDINAEEEARFVTLDECDYVLAARYKDYTQYATRTSNVVQDIFKSKEQWQTVLSLKLLDSEFSDPALRAFFIPFVSERFVRHGLLELYRKLSCGLSLDNSYAIFDRKYRQLLLYSSWLKNHERTIRFDKTWRNDIPLERTALGSDHDESSLHERGWPWRFKQPGRLSTELPGEEAFTGFGGLEELLGDLDTDIDDSSDEHREVSREIRNACYCQVSIDRAPGAEVIVLSETGAMLTGIPPEAVSITTNGYQGQQMFTREGSSGASSIRWSTRKHKELAHYLTGTIISRGSQPLGCCYGGHQFGHWVGQLGDGRVATLGEIWAVCNRDDVADIISTWCGSLIEVQLKGIGKTPFSRGGDGKAVLDSCLLEYFFSQAFIGLGLGTAVAVAVCSTGENTVTRDEDPDSSGTLKRVPGAVLCRAAPSFLRFGSFELPARRSELNVVRGLADFCLRHLGPHLETDEFFVGSFPCLAKDPSPTARADELTEQHSISSFSAGQERERSLKPFLPKGEKGRAEESTGSCMGEAGTRNAYLELLVNVIQATARMVASWQALGFCHGVLNTDNFTLLGIAIDFGSCGKLENHRFMERYDPTWCPNKSDSGLRYTFQKQPDISAWNCERLAEAFSSLIGVSGIAEAKKAFSPAFDAAYSEHLQRKLGLTNMKLGSGWVDILKSVDADGRDTVGDVSSDARFVLELFRLMSCSGTDFTRTWRSLIDVPPLSEALHARVGSAECFAPIHSNDGASAWDGNPLESRNKNGGAVAEKSARECDKGVELSDDEVLRPVIYVLRASRVYREHRRHWACWIMEYMARIDSQGIGRLHHGGAEEGRRERFDTMRNSNPVFVLRASDLKQALNAVHAEDMMLVRRLDKKLSSPYASESVEEILPSCASQCNAGTGIP